VKAQDATPAAGNTQNHGPATIAGAAENQPASRPRMQLLTSGSIPIQIRDLALPSSIGLFFQTMYNVVDSFYAGLVSTEALAALGLSFPVYLLIIATSGGLSRGASALIANAIGSGEVDKQQHLVAQSVSLGVLTGLTLTVVGLNISSTLFYWLGATGEFLEIAQSYMNPILSGSLLFVMTNLCNAILIASGDSRTYGRVLIVGFFANLVLDPWFLFGGFGLPAMGIAGIAWATVVIQFFSAMFMISMVIGRGLLHVPAISVFIPNPAVYAEIGRQAVPACFNILSVAMGFFVTTFYLKTYGAPTVAAFGVTTRIEQICLLPTIGLYASIMAIVGQNNGAKNYDRIRETMKLCNRLGFGISLTISLLMWIFARQLMTIFTRDAEVISIGVGCLRIIMLVQWSYVMTSTHLAMLQAVKRPMYGFFESILRKVLLPLPFFHVLVVGYGMSVDAVWYSIAGTNVFMTMITVVYAQIVLRRMK